MTALGQLAGQVSVALDNALAFQRIADLNARLAKEKLYLEDELLTETNFNDIIGNSRALKRVLKQIETVAPTDSTVLILGETGTGKERLARAVHDLSPRRGRPFVRVNCASVPAGLLESELFGHEKGAFTGAIAQRIGRFELAHQGTLFLDEVGEIPLELQSKLLRVLQEKQFERLGNNRTMTSDVRIVAATNRDLNKLVASGQFRSDLFYRLSVFPVMVPPLRDRAEDIPLLVHFFLARFAKRMGKDVDVVPPETMQALCRYSWPGNVRELEHVVERAVILSPGPELRIPLTEFECRRGQCAGRNKADLFNTRGDRAWAHPYCPQRNKGENRRRGRCGRTPWNESYDPQFPHAEAWNLAQRHLNTIRPS